MMEAVFLRVLNMSLSAAVVIAAVLLVRGLLRLVKAPKKWSYLLWSVAGFRLCCPMSLKSAFSIFTLAPVQPAAAQTGGIEYIPRDVGMMAQPRVDIGTPQFSEAVGASLPAAEPSASVNPLQIWIAAGTLLWCAGMAALLVYGVVSYVRMKRRLADAVLLRDNIYETDRIRSPFILGIFKPIIYLPLGLDGNMLRYVLAHEQYHIRRRDYLVKILAFLLLTVHWFNPLAWLAFYLMGRDMEMSCDEKVLAGESGIAKAYGMTLLSFATNRRFPAPGPLAFGETGVKGRIKNVLNWKKPKLWVTLAAVALCAVAVAACATNPAEAEESAVSGWLSGDDAVLAYVMERYDVDGKKITGGEYQETGHRDGADYKIFLVDTEDGETYSLTVRGELQTHRILFWETGRTGPEFRVAGIAYARQDQLPPAEGGGGDSRAQSGDGENPGYDAQIALIAANADVWRVYDESDGWGYAVTDLDQNGRLEIVAAECHGTGHFSTGRIWEVGADGMSLIPVEGIPTEYGSGPWMLDESVPVFYDGARDLYHYVFTGIIKLDASHYSETKTALTIFGGAAAETDLALREMTYTETSTRNDYALPDGTAITAADYALAADRAYGDCRKLYAALPWIRDVRLDALSADELAARLEESRRGFGFTDMWLRSILDFHADTGYREYAAVMLRPTERTDLDGYGYYVPEAQDIWRPAWEAAMRLAYTGEPLAASELTGVLVTWQEEYWALCGDGSLANTRNGALNRVPAGTELAALVQGAEDFFGIDPVYPEQLRGIRSATLRLGENEYVLTDPAALARIETLLSNATEYGGLSACWYTSLLTLELENGRTYTISIATDSCGMYLSDGLCFRFANGNEEFYSDFGVSMEA